MNKLKIRGTDAHGSGHFGASRGGGKRAHVGVDAITVAGEKFQSRVTGAVSHIGYPYAGDLHYRYIEITDKNGWRWRYFYVKPCVAVGDKINAGDAIGICQDLDKKYPKITQHVHFEIKVNGKFIDPTNYLNKIEELDNE